MNRKHLGVIKNYMKGCRKEEFSKLKYVEVSDEKCIPTKPMAHSFVRLFPAIGPG